MMKILTVLIALLTFPGVGQDLAEAFQMAKQTFHKGEYQEAFPLFDALWKKAPGNGEIAYYLGLISFRQGKFDKSSDWFNKASELSENNAVYQNWLGRSLGREAQKASFFRQPFLARGSKSAFEKAVTLAPDSIDFRMDLITYYMVAPGIVGGSKEKASEQAAEIANLDPIAGIKAKAYLHVSVEEYQQAEAIYRQGIAEHPEAAELYLRLGDVLARQSRYDDAIALGKQALETLPDQHDQILVELGRIYISAENYPAAFQSLADAIEMTPTHYYAHYLIGKASSLSNTNPERGIQALSYYLENGEQLSQAAISWAYYRLGKIYQDQQDLAEAKSAYLKSLKHNEDHEQAKAALKALKN